jgi:hypothetical protein
VPWPGTRTTWSESAHVGTSTLRLVCPGATVPWTLIVLLAHWPVMVERSIVWKTAAWPVAKPCCVIANAAAGMERVTA